MTRRIIRVGESYTIDEVDAIELIEVTQRPAPMIEVQGEPWGWTKPGNRPRGWPGPADSEYGERWKNLDDPGPYDGEWEAD